MNQPRFLQNPFLATWNVISLPKFVLLVAPLTITMLAILILAFQLNRQLYDQQQVIVNRLAHAAVRHVGQLQREELRLYVLIADTRDQLDEEQLVLQRDLVNSRFSVLHNTLAAVNPPTAILTRYTNSKAQWTALQPTIDAWLATPTDAARKQQIMITLEAIELNANQLATDLQALFEDRMQIWSNKSRFLNRLLTYGSFSFVIIILLMAYVIYLFFQNQNVNQAILRVSEQRLRSILDAIPDAVYRLSSAGIFIDYKPPANDAHRFPGESFYRKHLSDVLPAPVAESLQAGIASVLADGKQLLHEYSLTDQAHQLRRYEARLLPSSNDEVQLIVRDITDVKLQEEAALQAQKLESLGVLAGGIAHDFNNLLTGMLGQASLAVAKLQRGLPALDHVQKVVLSAERAADLTRQLLAYTGKGKFQIDLLDLNQLMRETAALMSTALPSQAELEFALTEDLPRVQVDRGQIQQVVMNLFINAIEALPEGSGKVTITTGIQEIEEATAIGQPARGAQSATVSELQPGQYVFLRVSDTGSGMDQATLSRIFDPFFSTKAKGHGLGLSATQGIIRTHQGALQVQSQPGVGTTFTMLLPAALVHTSESEPVGDVTPFNGKDQQSVLVIDDEAPVREAATDILAEQGFQVTAAANGHEGIDLFRRNHQQIDLVLLDMKMPGINGAETYQQLQQIQPNLKVIFTSGYSEAELAPQLSASTHVTFLAKPYSAELLMHQIQKILTPS
jgi:signal transduction histidine kinase